MNYRSWLKTQLKHVEHLADHPEPDVPDFEHLRAIVAEAGRRAAACGLPDAVRATKIRRGPISPTLCREILAACLAAVPTPQIDLLTIQDASQRFGISSRTLYRLVESGKLACSRVGTGRGRIRLKAADVERYLQQPQATGKVDYLFG